MLPAANNPVSPNGEASMAIENSEQIQGQEETTAALEVMALAETQRSQGRGFSAAESRAQLAAARQRRT